MVTLISGTNRDAEENDSNEISAAIESSRDSERVNCVDEESQEQSSKSSGDTQCMLINDYDGALFWLIKQILCSHLKTIFIYNLRIACVFRFMGILNCIKNKWKRNNVY